MTQGMRQRYSLKIKIVTEKRMQFVPYSLNIDFDRLFSEKAISGKLDRNSILIMTADGNPIHYNLSDDFLYANSGSVRFLIEDTKIADYLLYYDSDQNGPFPMPDYIGLVGNGDCLRANQNIPLPLYNGMNGEGHFADIDGDGQGELIIPQYYSHVKDREWHVVNGYRNVGSPDSPVWGDAVPLRCLKDGCVGLMHGASAVQICDLNGDGLPDILTCGYGAYNPSKSEVYIHINTGRTDTSGFPLFEYRGAIVIPGAQGYIGAFKYVDLMDSGNKGILFSLSFTRKIEREDALWFAASEEEKAAARWPRWVYMCSLAYCAHDHFDENGVPVLKPPVWLTKENGIPLRSYSHIGFDTVYNADTKMHDILYSSCTGDYAQFAVHCRTDLTFLRNSGKAAADGGILMKEIRRYPGIQDRSSMSIKLCDMYPYRGLFKSSGQLGGRVVYYPLIGQDENGCPEFGTPEYLLQKNPYVNSFNGFAKASVNDFDNDGDVDIATGCENTYALLIENIGTRRKPVFSDAKHFLYMDKVIEMMNGPFDDPGSFSEAPLGQTSVFYADYNFDGVPDLIIKVGQRLYLYENAGTASEPSFSSPMELFTEYGNRFGAHRNHPAIGDFTGDGCPDIICDARDMKALMLFRGFRDDSGKLCFHEGEELKYDDGSLIIPKLWHRYTKHWSFGDYAGNGNNDLMFNTCTNVMWLENVGTNTHPRFRRPAYILDADGSELNIGHHVCMPIPVDWDGTGKNDILISGESGLFYLFRRNYLNGAHHWIDYEVKE